MAEAGDQVAPDGRQLLLPNLNGEHPSLTHGMVHCIFMHAACEALDRFLDENGMHPVERRSGASRSRTTSSGKRENACYLPSNGPIPRTGPLPAG